MIITQDQLVQVRRRQASTPLTFGLLLRLAREAAEMKMEVAAKAFGISPTMISLVENDKRVPSWDTIEQISETLGIPFEVLAVSAGIAAKKRGRIEVENGKAHIRTVEAG